MIEELDVRVPRRFAISTDILMPYAPLMAAEVLEVGGRSGPVHYTLRHTPVCGRPSRSFSKSFLYKSSKLPFTYSRGNSVSTVSSSFGFLFSSCSRPFLGSARAACTYGARSFRSTGSFSILLWCFPHSSVTFLLGVVYLFVYLSRR